MSGWDSVASNEPKKVQRNRRKSKKTGGEIKEEKPKSTADDFFSPISECEVSDKLKVAVYGDPGSGKSHFAASFPEPVFVIDTENRFARLGSKYPGKDIRVMHCYEEDDEGLFDPVATLHKAEVAIARARAACKDGAVGTIVIDSASDIWVMAQEYMKVEHLSRDRFALVNREGWNWGIANKRNDAVVMKALVQDCNVVVTGKAAYDEAGLSRGTWRKDVPYAADVILYLSCAQDDESEEPIYTATIEKCAENGLLQTTVHENMDYEQLYNLVNPASDHAEMAEEKTKKKAAGKSSKKK